MFVVMFSFVAVKWLVEVAGCLPSVSKSAVKIVSIMTCHVSNELLNHTCYVSSLYPCSDGVLCTAGHSIFLCSLHEELFLNAATVWCSITFWAAVKEAHCLNQVVWQVLFCTMLNWSLLSVVCASLYVLWVNDVTVHASVFANDKHPQYLPMWCSA